MRRKCLSDPHRWSAVARPRVGRTSRKRLRPLRNRHAGDSNLALLNRYHFGLDRSARHDLLLAVAKTTPLLATSLSLFALIGTLGGRLSISGGALLRMRRFLYAVMALILVWFGLSSSPAAADPTPSPTNGPLSEREALRQAKDSGKPVVVSSLTDERTLVTADPVTGLLTK